MAAGTDRWDRAPRPAVRGARGAGEASSAAGVGSSAAGAPVAGPAAAVLAVAALPGAAAPARVVAATGSTGNEIGGSGGKKLSTHWVSPRTRLVAPVVNPLTSVGPIRSN